MKRFLIVSILALVTLTAVAQTNTASLDMNPADAVSTVLSFIPPKYQKLILALIVLVPIAGRAYASLKNGGKVAGTLKSLVFGHSVKLDNEVSALKAVTGLTQAPPTPPAAVVVPEPPAPGSTVNTTKPTT